MKNSTIKLAHYVTVANAHQDKDRRQWKVLQVTDSVKFNPGQWLEKPEVQALCEDGAWKVTIVAAPDPS